MSTVPTVEIDGNDVTAEIAHGSLTWSLNTVDLRLVDPAVLPALGDVLTVDEPAFSGDVTNIVSEADDLGNIVWAQVTATNTDEWVAAAAPFGLSDTPNGSTTFGYRKLVVTATHANDADELRATLEVREEGLFPGMTVELTSAIHGFAAQEFTIQEMQVGWDRDDAAVYALTLGDPVVKLSTWASEPVSGIFPIDSTKITDGAVTTPKLAADAVIANVVNVGSTVTIDDDGIELKDEFGGVSLTTEGFAGTWADLLGIGLYNGLFAQGASGAVADGRTVDLPYWDIWFRSNAAVTREAQSGWPSGYRLKIDPSATDGQVSIKSDPVPIIPLGWYQPAMIHGWNVVASGSAVLTFTISVHWLDESLSDLSHDDVGASYNGTSSGGPTDLDPIDIPPLQAPVGARYAQVFLIFLQAVGNNASNLGYFGGASLRPTIPSDVALTSATIDNLQVTTTLNLDTAGVIQGGNSSFPGSPDTGDRFYRSDYRLWFVYDGTRWLTEQLFAVPFGAFAASATFAINFSATQATMERCSLHQPIGTDIWLEYVTLQPFIASGGSALSGSHKWVATLSKVSAANSPTSLGTYSIDSGSSNVWRPGSITIGALLGTETILLIDWAKTGTPGNLNSPASAAPKAFYRIVAT